MGKIGFVFPIDGDCINKNDGVSVKNGIGIEAIVSAPADAEVYICGKKASYSDGFWKANVIISNYRTVLAAEDRSSGAVCEITVLRFADPVGKYRLSSDDNILFLQDITANKDNYKSIFENAYLAMYKKAHELYGAKVHLNLFYEFIPDPHDFSDVGREYFNLSMMTDKFRDEFERNSDWLKLAFHANSERPDKPYRDATAEQIRADFLKIRGEIVRFAGERVLSDSTTVHWGEGNREVIRELHALGLRSLTGYFRRTASGAPLVSYYFDGESLDHIGSRDFFYDRAEEMIFGQIDIVLNEKTCDHVAKELHRIADDPQRGGFISLMIHEQYFHHDYRRYLPDFEARVLDSCAYLHLRGYVGVHISELTSESKEEVAAEG